MFKAIWFMLKTGLLVFAAMWLAERSGQVEIQWQDYTFTIHLGLFLLAFAFVILAAILLYRLVRFVFGAPAALSRHQERRRFEKGYTSLTRGLTAVAAGDAKAAQHHAQRVIKYWPEDNGIPVLLQAQAARLAGDDKLALQHFSRLAEDKDAGFLGVRGLLHAALDAGKTEKALGLALSALEKYPHQKWLLNLAYDLQVQTRRWDEALATLRKARKAGAIEAQKAKSDEIALLLAAAQDDFTAGKDRKALSRLKKAHKLNPFYVPAVAALARYYIGKGKRRSGVRILEEAWRAGGHPAYVPLWDALVPKTRSVKKALQARLEWFEKLLELPEQPSADVYMALARVCLEQKYYGQARDYTQKARELEQTARVYKLRAVIEENADAKPEEQRLWLERAADAPPSACWVCAQTGRVYEEWQPIATPHGSFNTIVWQPPVDVTSYQSAVLEDEAEIIPELEGQLADKA